MNNVGTIYLFTKRCLLRRFEFNDITNVFNAYLSDEKTFKYLNSEVHKNIYQSEFLINEIIKNYNNKCYYNWLIINKYNNEIIGTISLHEIDVYNDKCEIGIIIVNKYQKHGYAKEVIDCIVSFAFYKLNVHRIEAKVICDNLASNNLFKSLNFNFEAIIHSSVKKNNKFYDVNLYYLINK